MKKPREKNKEKLTKPAGTVFSTLWSTLSRKVSRHPSSLSAAAPSLPNCSWAAFIALNARFLQTLPACCSINKFHWTYSARKKAEYIASSSRLSRPGLQRTNFAQLLSRSFETCNLLRHQKPVMYVGRTRRRIVPSST